MIKIMTASATERAHLILTFATEAKDAFYEHCNTSRQARRATGGALTHAEQDLLRAMLVFSCAGLDSLLKHLIRDSLQLLAARDPRVQAELETFVGRQIRDDTLASQDDSPMRERKFLAHVLVAASPLERIVEQYVTHLTGESLQSAEQLFKAVKALGIVPEDIGLDAYALKTIFIARNEIIHEMDIRLEPKKKKARKRRSRTIDDMTQKAEYILDVGEKVIKAVEAKLV